MPFTLAHPGFALFFKRKNTSFLDAIGLTIGSIVPDLDILFRFTNSRFHLFTYSAQEVFFLILPISIAFSIYFLWLKLTIDGQEFSLHLSRLLAISISCLVGILIHLLIDKYTHLNAAEIVTNFDHRSDYGYRFYNRLYLLLQYGPSIIVSFVGFLFLGFYFKKRKLARGDYLPMDIDRKKLFLFTIVLFCISFFIKLLISGMETYFYFDSVVIGLTAAFLATCCIVPLLITMNRRFFTK